MNTKVTNPCSICAGTKELLTGQPCGCKDGTIHGELHFVRMCAFKAQQQRDAALKLADKWEQYAENFREQSKDWLASLPKNVDPPSYIHDECAADLRAIFAPKEGE